MSCVLLDSHIYVMEKINICTTVLFFIMSIVSQSIEENNENETNVETPNNYFKLHDVTFEKLSFLILSNNFENHTF